jgi:hypothetical protein
MWERTLNLSHVCKRTLARPQNVKRQASIMKLILQHAHVNRPRNVLRFSLNLRETLFFKSIFQQTGPVNKKIMRVEVVRSIDKFYLCQYYSPVFGDGAIHNNNRIAPLVFLVRCRLIRINSTYWRRHYLHSTALNSSDPS